MEPIAAFLAIFCKILQFFATFSLFELQTKIENFYYFWTHGAKRVDNSMFHKKIDLVFKRFLFKNLFVFFTAFFSSFGSPTPFPSYKKTPTARVGAVFGADGGDTHICQFCFIFIVLHFKCQSLSRVRGLRHANFAKN